MAVLATTIVAGCDRETGTPSGDDDRLGLPNPAATFCIEQGGEYYLDKGTCKLEDGTEVDAWAYFREHNEDTP